MMSGTSCAKPTTAHSQARRVGLSLPPDDRLRSFVGDIGDTVGDSVQLVEDCNPATRNVLAPNDQPLAAYALLDC